MKLKYSSYWVNFFGRVFTLVFKVLPKPVYWVILPDAYKLAECGCGKQHVRMLWWWTERSQAEKRYSSQVPPDERYFCCSSSPHWDHWSSFLLMQTQVEELKASFFIGTSNLNSLIWFGQEERISNSTAQVPVPLSRWQQTALLGLLLPCTWNVYLNTQTSWQSGGSLHQPLSWISNINMPYVR